MSAGEVGAIVLGGVDDGATQHGVARFAEDVLAHLPEPLRGGVVVVRAPDAPALLARPGWSAALTGCRWVHLQYTDALFGPTGEQAADNLVRLVALLHDEVGARCSVTLHDLPQPGDGERLFPRRAAGYRRVVEAVDAVVLSSEHESALLDALGPVPRPRSVVPLPVDPPPRPVRPTAVDRDVTVLGFVHPGKGHADALAAMVGLPAEVGLTALGRTGPGHERLADDLAATAAADGRRVRVTGFVPDPALTGRLRTAGVPLAPHRAVSASGSIGTWITAGRRPLVPAGPYAAEVQRRCPGALRVYEREELPAALALALAEPWRTWVGDGVRVGPSRPEVSAAYARLWTRG